MLFNQPLENKIIFTFNAQDKATAKCETHDNPEQGEEDLVVD